MTPKQEINEIGDLGWEISELSPDAIVHTTKNGCNGVTVTVFKGIDVDWTETVSDRRQGQDYPAKLRFLRHTLEEMHKEALGRRELVA